MGSDAHPYLQYMIDVRRSPRGMVPLPARAPYIARCFKGSEFCEVLNCNNALEVDVNQSEKESIPSTVASPTELQKFTADEDVFWDCREEEDEEVMSVRPEWIPSQSSIWTLLACGYVRRMIA